MASELRRVSSSSPVGGATPPVASVATDRTYWERRTLQAEASSPSEALAAAVRQAQQLAPLGVGVLAAVMLGDGERMPAIAALREICAEPGNRQRARAAATLLSAQQGAAAAILDRALGRPGPAVAIEGEQAEEMGPRQRLELYEAAAAEMRAQLALEGVT